MITKQLFERALSHLFRSSGSVLSVNNLVQLVLVGVESCWKELDRFDHSKKNLLLEDLVLRDDSR